MSYIEWKLDEDEDEELDAYDPVGLIIIRGENGVIKENSTYLDAFFEAIIKGIQQVEVGKTIAIDPLVEPDDIFFECNAEQLNISYDNSTTKIYDKVKFLNDLRHAVYDLVNTIDELTQSACQEKRKLFILRRFIENQNDNPIT